MSVSGNVKARRILGLCTVLFCATQIPAQPAPTTQPKGPGAEQRPADDLEARMRERRREILAGGPATPAKSGSPDELGFPRPIESEWQTFSEQMRAHSPNTWERVDRMSGESPVKMRMMRAMVDRYRDLKRIEQRDPEQYKRELKQIELEDQILGVAKEVRKSSSDGDSSALKQKLRDLVGQLVDLRIANREARLKRLAAMLNAEQEKLDADKRSRDQAVERHFGAAMKGRVDPGTGRPGGPPRPEDGPPRRHEPGEGVSNTDRPSPPQQIPE